MRATIDFEDVFDQIPGAFILLDDEDKIVRYNVQARAYEHLAAQPFRRGISYCDLISEERLRIVPFLLKEARAGRRQVSEAEYHDAAGKKFSFELIFSPIYNSDKEVVFICVHFHEITAEKTFEKRALDLINEKATIFENANALIFSIDSRGYITEWNRECVRVSGQEKTDVYARKIFDFVYEKEKFQQFVDHTFSSKATGTIELQLVSDKHAPVIARLNASVKLNQLGVPVGILFVGQDITELSQYQSSLEQMVKENTEELKKTMAKEKELVEIKNKFVSIASHEMRSPLTSIASAASFLRNTVITQEAGLEKVDAIIMHVKHMQALMEDLLTIGKTEATPLSANMQRVNLVDFLKQVSNEVMGSSQHTHYFNLSFESDSLFINSNEKLLRNIFINAFSNAVKFSPGKTEIDVSLQTKNDEVIVQITDHGIGIDPSEMHKIFEPFNRGSNVSQIKGTGLGLSIMKRAVETLGGTLEINSVLNKGTTVSITFKKVVY
jgi:PAS domain S-box-containing protein